MSQNTIIPIYIISDSVGETANNLAQAAMVQFPNVQFKKYKKNFINSLTMLQETLKEAKQDNALILYTLVNTELLDYLKNYCDQHNLFALDLLGRLIQEIASRTHQIPQRAPGAIHSLNKNYFNRIDAIEFAVRYDDGKDPSGLLKADIVLLGISRTSKTPLSLFLANKNFKVANLPLIPESPLPKELWKVPKNKLVGLTNDPYILKKIRSERMIAYGLDPETPYSSLEKIEKELEYAHDLYQKLGCIEINVANRSIEETASIILKKLCLETPQTNF